METNHPFSPTAVFPLSFLEEDMMLFTGGATSTNGPHGTSTSAADFAAAWADMGMGQGRSVSSIMDPYHIDTTAAAGAGPTSPTLASPLAGGADGNMGFLSPRGNKKRSSNVDAMGNPLPLPSLSHPLSFIPFPPSSMTPPPPAPSAAAAIMLDSHVQHHQQLLLHHHHQYKNNNHNNTNHHQNNTSKNNNDSNSSNHIDIDIDIEDDYNYIPVTTGITISNHSPGSTTSSFSIFDEQTMDMTRANANHLILHSQNKDDEDLQIPATTGTTTTNTNASNNNNSANNIPPQKRRRRDTATNTNTNNGNGGGGGGGGSNTDGGFSSGDEDADGRRESMIIGPDGKRQERPRLTEEEKKNNHIASEQKRRMAIRDGFDRLTELVPGIEGQGRSESIVLRKTVDYMRQVIEDRRNLIAQVQELGGEVPQELMLR
ncbi:hypothetical protein AA313_de0205293 [Arthrobotrys entomopaga]|nr:hypothetical protein AA313_de0205293 [Arthrobotrys entomopaga]